MAKKPTLKERLQEHVAEYGSIALVVYFSISALTILGFYVAIKTGANVGDSAAGSSGSLFAAWVAAKITLPLRIGATFILTPIVAAIMHKIKGKPSPKSADDADESNDSDSGDDESGEGE
jgi:hypothetical protein